MHQHELTVQVVCFVKNVGGVVRVRQYAQILMQIKQQEVVVRDHHICALPFVTIAVVRTLMEELASITSATSCVGGYFPAFCYAEWDW